MSKKISKKKQNVSYIKPEEPAFLKRIKAQVGYKEGPTIEAKRQRFDEDAKSEDEDNLLEEKEEEQPQIVQLKEGDLSNEEVQKLVKAQQQIADKKKIDDGKIEFKKPQKKEIEENEVKKSEVKEKKPEKKAPENKKLDNREQRLLSFGEEEED